MVLDNLVNESYEYLLEYQNTLYELDMKMIKCEHACIVNEDSNMMMLAEEEYKNKVQATLKAIWNKIVITIERFIIEIRKFINNIKTKFLLKKDIKEKLQKITKLYNTDGTSFDVETKFKNKKYEDGYSDGHQDVSKLNTGKLRLTEWDIDVILNNNAYDTEIRKVFGELTSGDNEAAKKALEMFDSFKPNKTPDSGDAIFYRTKGFSKLIINAYETMQKAPEWIRLLEKCRNDAKQKARLIGSEDVKSTADATYYQRTINKGIMHIQKIMNASFKILYTLEKIDFTDNTEKVKREKEMKEYTRKQKEAMDNLRKTKEDFSKKSQARHDKLNKVLERLKDVNNEDIKKQQEKNSKDLDDLLGKINKKKGNEDIKKQQEKNSKDLDDLLGELNKKEDKESKGIQKKFKEKYGSFEKFKNSIVNTYLDDDIAADLDEAKDAKRKAIRRVNLYKEVLTDEQYKELIDMVKSFKYAVEE